MTYKRTVSILTILAMIICAMALFTTVDTYAAAKHTHKYGAYKVTKKATCTKAGKKVRKCKKCSKTQTVTIPKKGHSYGAWKVTKKATCEAAGTKQRTCKSCKAVQKQTIAKTAHKYGAWTVTKKATCTANGKEEKACTVCGVKVTASVPATGKHVWAETPVVKIPSTCAEPGTKVKCCLVGGEEKFSGSIATLDHDFSGWQVERKPTCVTPGREIRTCADCLQIEERSIPATGKHIYGEMIVDKAATCTEDGHMARYCEMCGLKTDDTVIKAEGHDYQVTSRTEPRHDKEIKTSRPGTISYKCTRCGDRRYETIPAPEHHNVVTKTTEATCTERGREDKVCTICGQEFFSYTSQPTGHNWADTKVTDKEATCTQDGQRSIHCQNPGCDDVKDVEKIPNKGGHVWSEWTVKTKPTCTASGLDARTCDVCGTEETKKTASYGGHDFTKGEPEVIKAATCTETGIMGIRCSHDGCTSYKQTATIGTKGHVWNDNVTLEPTCTEEGSKTRTCSVCGTTKDISIPANGGSHHWAEGGEIVQGGDSSCVPTVQYKECLDCGVKEYVTVSAGSGHNWVEYTNSRGSEHMICSRCGKYQAGWGKLPVAKENKKDPDGPDELTDVKDSYRCGWIAYFTTDMAVSEGFNNHSGLRCSSIGEIRIVGGSSGYEESQFTTISMKAPAPREGYRFTGWKNAATGGYITEGAPAPDGRYKVKGDVLILNWRADDMTFTPVYEKIQKEEAANISQSSEKAAIVKPEEQEEPAPAEEEEEKPEPADMTLPEDTADEADEPEIEE